MKQRTYIEVHSEHNVNVTAGLMALDMTDAKAGVADKLKIQPLWAKQIVRLAPGKYWYPAEIKDWNTVKALVEAGKVTLGREATELPADLSDEVKAFIESNFEKLELGKEEAKRQIDEQQKVEQDTATGIKLTDLKID